MKSLRKELRYYDAETTSIRITRFIECAEHLSNEGLWSKVEELALAAGISSGGRVEIDSLLANAVKLALVQHHAGGTIDEVPAIVVDTIKCGGGSRDNRSGRSGRGGGRG